MTLCIEELHQVELSLLPTSQHFQCTAAGLPMSLLSLANNSCVGATFERMHERFAKLYRRRVFLHHYVQYMPVEDIQAASHAVSELIHDYGTLPQCCLASNLPQPKPLGLSFV